MSANPQHDEPFRLLGALGISLRVSQRLDLYGVGLLDLVGCSVADEDGLASPFDNDLDVCLACQWEEVRVLMMRRGSPTFLPSGIAERSTSTLAMARTSAEADMLTRKSAGAGRGHIVSDPFPPSRRLAAVHSLISCHPIYSPSPPPPHPAIERSHQAHLG